MAPMARASARPSRADMLLRGVPEEYIDSLLDEKYMEDLIAATNKQYEKREKKRNRQDRLQRVTLIFLICQALLGVAVALYKTVLQPDNIFSAKVTMENIDMVLMMDTSNHMKGRREQQQDVVLRFSDDMLAAMQQERKDIKEKNAKRVEEMKEKASTAFSRFMSYFIHTKSKDYTWVSGGRLRFATGIFNRDSETLHAFTNNLTIQKKAVDLVVAENYKSFTHLNKAMESCVETFKEAKNNTKKYCVLIGDNEAMCRKPQSEKVNELAQDERLAHLFPKDFLDVGAAIEYSYEFDSCKDYVAGSFEDIKLVMMFTVGSKEEEQMRLRNRPFRNFVENTTGCEFEIITRTEDKGKFTNKIVEYKPEEEKCTRFIMGHGLDDVLAKSKAIVQLLQSSPKDFEEPNKQKDDRYLVFLLMPLNLVFFLGASAIARWYARFQMKAAKVMGRKKKMIKVTKTLVEKDKRKSVVSRFAALHTEVEMAEVKKLQPLVKLSSPMTLRARLKGGHLRHNAQEKVMDGNGTAFDPAAFWNFEAIGEDLGPDAVMQAGQPVHITNSKGELCISAGEGGKSKTKFVPASEAALETQFVVCATTSDEDPVKLGETLRIMCKATGQYLRVDKDGTCTANGHANEMETQLVVDQGGQASSAGGIFTFRAEVSQDALLNGNPNGSLQVAPAGTWSHWMVEKTGTTHSAEADGQNLRIGDIVTLKALSGQLLQVDPGSKVCHCGDPTAELSSVIPEKMPSSSSSGRQEFVIERVGMGGVNLHDLTIRKGATISFKPYSDGNGASDDLNYLKVNMNGSITSNGRATDREIGFVMEAGSVNQMLTPLGNALFQGDVDLLVAPLWNKSDFKHHDALSSSWTHDEELSKFKGAVVVANEQGGYTVPKAAGEGKSEWVAVVNEGVDLRKAAAQAKKQGATGLIIRCEQALSLEKLAASAEDEIPELPAVFVTPKVGEALKERGIVLKGCEFKKKYMTEVMRSLGRLGGGGPSTEKYKTLFQAVGNAIIQEEKEKAKAPVVVQKVAQPVSTESQGKFKWKVNTNTAYIWSGSGGGATTMAVDFGKQAPPSAQQHKMVIGEDGKEVAHVDASADIVPEMSRRSMVGQALVPVEEFKAHTLAEELSEVLLEDSSTAQQEAQMQQLSDESDFMFEYTFAEVEVPVNSDATNEEEEDETIEDGSAIRKVGVPRRFFWIIAAFLVLTTTALAWLLHANLNSEIPIPEGFENREEEDEAMILFPEAAASLRFLAKS